MTAQLRTVQGKSPEEIRAAIVEDVLAKVGPHFDEREKRILEAATRRSLEEHAKLQAASNGRHAWRAASIALLAGIIVGAMGMRTAMDYSLLTGVAIGRGEAGNEQLKQMEQQQ